MIGLDTNILVRLVVADDPAQTARAQRFVETRCTPEAPGFINCIVLVEFVWVLASVYDYQRSQIASALEALLAGDDRIVEHHEAVRASLDDYRSGRTDLVEKPRDAQCARSESCGALGYSPVDVCQHDCRT